MQIRSKFILSYLFIAVGALLIMAVLAYSHARQQLEASANMEMNQQLSYYVSEWNGWLNYEAGLESNNCEFIELFVGDGPVTIDHLQIHESHPNITNYYVGFEDGSFIDSSGWAPPEGYDPRLRPWYREVVTAGRQVFSQPYLDMETNQTAVSVGIPLHWSDGRLRGVIGADILLETFRKHLTSVSLDGEGYGFIVGPQGRIIAHPNASLYDTDGSSDPLMALAVPETIKSDEGSITITDMNGTGYLLAWKKMSVTGWTLAMIVPESTAYNGLTALRNDSITTSGLILLLVIVFAILSAQRLSRPLTITAAHAQRIAAGQLDSVLPRSVIDSRDETGILARSITEMSQSLISMLNQVNEKAALLEASNATLLAAEEQLRRASEELETKVTERTHQLAEANNELQALNDELHKTVEALAAEVEERRRTESRLAAANEELSATLERLHETQDDLIQSEKMASLGQLVAGVAHEINTPVGISVTAASHLADKLGELKEKYATGQLKRQDMEQFIEYGQTGASILSMNLERAARLVQSFKEVALDQTYEEFRQFKARDYIDEILLSLRPRLKKSHVNIEVDCPPDLTVYGYPGALAQVLTNLVMNSLVHAYSPDEIGLIVIRMYSDERNLVLEYSDDGHGMTPDIKARIFDPFFTTKRGSGGSGLGLHIVYNIIVARFKGSIHCESQPGQGARFVMKVPLARFTSRPVSHEGSSGASFGSLPDIQGHPRAGEVETSNIAGIDPGDQE